MPTLNSVFQTKIIQKLLELWIVERLTVFHGTLQHCSWLGFLCILTPKDCYCTFDLYSGQLSALSLPSLYRYIDEKFRPP